MSPKEQAVSLWRSHLEDDPVQRPAQQIRAQIDGVQRFLALEPRSRVLDLGCGTGRQTLELARRGHRVLGVDASDKSMAESRAQAKAEKLNCHFMKHEPQSIPYRAEFDAVLTLSSAFGRGSERDELRTLEAILRGLKPGARLLIDQLNKEWLMRHFEPQSWQQDSEGQGGVLLEEVTFNFETGRLDSRRTIVAKDGKRTAGFASLRIYTLTELKALLARAGFAYTGCWGGFDGSAYGMDSPRMIVLAEKPREAPRSKPRPDEGLVTAIKIKGRRR